MKGTLLFLGILGLVVTAQDATASGKKEKACIQIGDQGSAADQVEPPKVTRMTTPDLGGLAGLAPSDPVVLEAKINCKGRVDDIQIKDTVNAQFSAAVVKAVRKWRFEPATLDGDPVAVHYSLTMDFKTGKPVETDD